VGPRAHYFITGEQPGDEGNVGKCLSPRPLPRFSATSAISALYLVGDLY